MTTARTEMQKWIAHDRQAMLSAESRERSEQARQKPAFFKDAVRLRGALLDFIADFANGDNSTVCEYLDTSRALTQAAHEALSGAPGPEFSAGGCRLRRPRIGRDGFSFVPDFLNRERAAVEPVRSRLVTWSDPATGAMAPTLLTPAATRSEECPGCSTSRRPSRG